MNSLRLPMGGVHKNICVFGANEIAVSVSAVIASKCPNVEVCVVDFNLEQVLQWEKKKAKGYDPDLQEVLEKHHNDNLSFMTDIAGAVLMADIILLMIDIPNSRNQKTPELQILEEIARLISEVTESNKIIVQKCLNVPFRMCETLKSTLNMHKAKKANFQVLAMPEFFSPVSPFSSLLNPEFVFIGYEETYEGEKAAAALMELYSRWISKDRIKAMDCLSVELIKIAVNALIAQRLITVGTFAAICEQAGKDIHEVKRILMKTRVGNRYLESTFSLGDVNIYRDSLKLIDLCEKNKFTEITDYWMEVIKQNEFQRNRFRKKIVSAFFNTLSNKRFAVFGISLKGNGKIGSEFPTVDLCARILEEGAMLSLFDPNVDLDKEAVLEALRQCGVENPQKRVTLYQDPYKAADKVHGIIICTFSKEFKTLDFPTIYKDMMKPPYIFDGQNTLDHECLLRMGFKVRTVGKKY